MLGCVPLWSIRGRFEASCRPVSALSQHSSNMSYKLRCSISAHSKDVRAIAVFNDTILSASRDATAKAWIPDGGIGFEERETFVGESSYVSAITALPPSSSFPDGLILTGSHDTTINLYSPGKNKPIYTMIGHTQPVVWLTGCNREEYVLSSSWDGSAKLWNTRSLSAELTFSSHNEAVWCVIQLTVGYIVTASADKTISVHLPNGLYKTTLKGHTDCVRGLCDLGDGVILSCSNDGTIRQWVIDAAACIESIKVHNNFLYGLGSNLEKSVTAYVGEGNMLAVWEKDTPINQRQNIYLPGESVWCVAVFSNTDVAVGSSDGSIRVFSKDPKRYASKAVQRQYAEEVIKGRLKNITDNLPGIEAIDAKGKMDGDVLFLTSEGKNHGYIWNEETASWEHIMAAELSPTSSKPKVLHNGKYYDFVFSVDANGMNLQLPFNKTDDPATVAQQFILDNRLEPSFLDNIVSFLYENSGLMRPTHNPSTSISLPDIVNKRSEYYPTTSYVFFDLHDFKIIIKKAEEFMNEMTFSPDEMDQMLLALRQLVYFKNENVQENIELLLQSIHEWDRAFVFVLLDILRIAVRNVGLQAVLFGSEKNRELLYSCIAAIVQDLRITTHHMLIFKTLANMFADISGENFVFDNKVKLVSLVRNLVDDNTSKGLQIAACTFLINLGSAAVKRKDVEGVDLCFELMTEIAPYVEDAEAGFRLLVALGTISQSKKLHLPEQIVRLIRTLAAGDRTNHIQRKAALCAADIIRDLLPPQDHL